MTLIAFTTADAVAWFMLIVALVVLLDAALLFAS
ncbi:hypothetical protein ACQP2C_13045 [Micromonospora zamorensis]